VDSVNTEARRLPIDQETLAEVSLVSSLKKLRADSGNTESRNAGHSRNLLEARRTGALWASSLRCFAETFFGRRVADFDFDAARLEPVFCWRACFGMGLRKLKTETRKSRNTKRKVCDCA
jgi:hypothetical protein